MQFPSTVILQLTIALIQAGYENNFKNFSGNLYKCKETSSMYHPAYYVYAQDDSTFIITRGSKVNDDYATAAVFAEETSEYGTFHKGYYKAALYIWAEVKDFVKYSPKKTKIYFIGHSYGGAVSQILHIFAANQHPSGDYTSFGYAAPPTMNEEASVKIKHRMFTFVNDDDIVPTLSIPNCLQRFHLIAPVLNLISTETLTVIVRDLLKVINLTSLVDQQLFNMIYNAAPTCVNAVKECEAGVPKLVKYTQGYVFQLRLGEPKKLSQCLVDPAKVLNSLSITFNCISRHKSERYIEIVDQIIPE